MTAPAPALVYEAALAAGVCVRPIVARVTDTETGETQTVPIACGATRETKCAPCADRARRLRMQQCREGWHLTDEPQPATDNDPIDDDQAESEDVDGDQAETDDAGHEEDRGRRVRSTRRRQDVADLPRIPMADRTIGATFTAPDGKTYRPSMFLTLTLDSYGPVDAEGCPRNPEGYDYRRAALDAIHFPKLVDRFWQNMRRCAGYRVQYFATVEAQRRLTPHLHAAVRGVVPRSVFHQVRAATYHQVWWPRHDTPVYTGDLPVYIERTLQLGWIRIGWAGYVDPNSGRPLPTWDQALDQLDSDPDAEPAHVVRFGHQDDYQGLLPGAPGTEWAIGYLCKYLTKSIAGTHHADQGNDEMSPARAAHIDRLAEHVRWLPCSPGCANWLRYGIQPADAQPGTLPGHCPGKAHDRENLGLAGRRVLVSRQWSDKTLTEHRADRAAVVRAALEEAGYDPDDHDQLAISGSDGRWDWDIVGRSQIDDRTYAAAVADTIATRDRWRREYEAAKALTGRGPPDGSDFGSSATTTGRG